MLFHTHPLVHLITNRVTMNKTVNGILATGGRAICADAPAEAEDITALADALVINTGMPSEERMRAMRIAGRKANAMGIPVVLDPVGAGASGFRQQLLKILLSEIRFTVIRGNASEIAALCSVSFRSGGVEDVGVMASPEAMRELSRRTGAVIIATGEKDLVIWDDNLPAGIDMQLPYGSMPAGTDIQLPYSSMNDNNSGNEQSSSSAVSQNHHPETNRMLPPDSDPAEDADEPRSSAFTPAGDRFFQTVSGGSPLQKQVTGSGCMLSGILGAALADERRKSAAGSSSADRRNSRSSAASDIGNDALSVTESRRNVRSSSAETAEKVTSIPCTTSSACAADFDTALRLLRICRQAAADAESMMRRQGFFGTMSYETFLTDALSRMGRPEWNRNCLSLYAVTDRTWLEGRTLADVTELTLMGGATMVQLREKNLDPNDFIREAKELIPLCHRFGVPLIINDNTDVCQKAGADGVHLGQGDMSIREARKILGPDAIIGATAHNVEEAVRAESDGADYLGSGAAFGSSTKKDATGIDPAEYRKITSSVRIPVVAIGGINEDNIMKLKGLGLAGVAVVSGIFAADDIEETAGRLKTLSGLIQ